MTDENRNLDPDESYKNNVKFETWTDRQKGRIYLRAEYDYEADAVSTLPSKDPTLKLDASPFGYGGIEEITLDYAYWTSTEEVHPRPNKFLPMWAIDAFGRHGYDVVIPSYVEAKYEGKALPDMGDNIIVAECDGGDMNIGDDPKFMAEVTVTATLPKLGTKEYTLSLRVENEEEAKENGRSLVPDEASIDDIDVDLEEL